MTHTELEAWHTERRKPLESTDFSALQFMLTGWLESLADRGMSPATWDAYRSTVTQFAAHTDLERAGTSDVQMFLARVRRGGDEAAPATKRRELAALRSFYRWAHALGFVAEDPAVGAHAPKPRNVDPKPIERAAFARLWSSKLLDLDARACLVLGFFCGLRRTEIMSLEAGRVNVESGLVESFVRKGGDEHTLPWRTMISVVLDRWPGLCDDVSPIEVMVRVAGRDGRLISWGTPHPSTLNRRLAVWCRRAGVPEFGPHRLRHSCATNLIEAGVPVQIVSQLLNHRSLDVTMRYVKMRPTALDEWKVQQESRGHDTRTGT